MKESKLGFAPTKNKTMKKLKWIVFIFALGFSISCTNDEGDTDLDVINPTEEEQGSLPTEILKKKDSKN